MHRKLKEARDKGNTTAPDLSGDLKSLENFVTSYLQFCDSSVPTENTLWELVNENRNSIPIQEQAYLDNQKELSELTHTYDEICKRLNKKFKKGVTAKLIKLVIDTFTLPTDPITLLVSTSLGYLEKLYNPEFIPVGVKLNSPEVQKGQAHLEQLIKEHEELTRILNADVADENEFIKRLQEGQVQARKCREISRRLFFEFRGVEPGAVEARREILEYLTAAAEVVDGILARKARLNKLEAYPPRVEFAHIGAPATVKITRRFDTGLELETDFRNLQFAQNIPELVKLAPAAGDEIPLTAIAAGEGEVRVDFAPDEKILPARFYVAVGSGTTPTPSPEPTATRPPPPPAATTSMATAIPAPTATAVPVVIPTATLSPTALSSAPARKYFKFTLSESDIRMGFNERRQVKATVWYTAAPHFIPVDVTADPNTKWETSWSAVATADRGTIESHSRPDWCTITARFTAPDGKSFSASCKVTVTDPAAAGPEVDFRIEPDERTYRVGQPLEFIQMVPPPHTNLEFTWYIEQREVAGKTAQHTFDSPGRYTIRLVVKSTVTGREYSSFKTVHVVQPVEMTSTPVTPPAAGERTPAPRPDARWRNRFEARKTDRGLDLRSSYFDIARNSWSEYRSFGRVMGETPETFIIATGEQADGINSGWLIYPDTSGNSVCLRYSVLSFKFSSKEGYVVYQGSLELHNKIPDPRTLKFKEVKPRGATAEWSCTDGSLCRAEISKSPPSGESMAAGGVKDLGCVEGGGREAGCTDEQIWSVFPAAAQLGFLPAEEKREKKASLSFRVKNRGFGYYTGYSSYWNRTTAAPSGSGDWWRSVNLSVNVYPGVEDAKGDHEQYIATGGRLNYTVREFPLGDSAFLLSNDLGPFNTTVLVRNAVIHASGQDTSQGAGNYYVEVDRAVLESMVERIRGLDCDLVPSAAAPTLPPLVLIKYKNTEWPARVVDGKLEVRGAKGIAGSWGTQWKPVASGVSGFKGAGTGKGPVLIYESGSRWHVVMLNWASGAPENRRSFDQEIIIRQPGEFGVILQVGDRCFDYSFNDLKEVWCETGKYK